MLYPSWIWYAKSVEIYLMKGRIIMKRCRGGFCGTKEQHKTNAFSVKQDKQNQQIKADSQNKLAHSKDANMSHGASNIFKSLRTHSAWGNMVHRGTRTAKGHHKTGGTTFKKQHG